MSTAAIMEDLISQLDCGEHLVWAPIRHHSPHCSLHLRQLIHHWQPEVLLVEGPSEANGLIPFLFAEDTQPPLAFFSYVVSKDKYSRSRRPEKQIRYRGYIPFASMSPEWVALEEAHKLTIESRFMDLPYVDRLQVLEHPEIFTGGEEKLLYDDHLLAQANPMERLIDENRCRDFHEWWDRHFEQCQEPNDNQSFFRRMHYLCLLLRAACTGHRHGEYNPQENTEPGLDAETYARELFMARQIFPYWQQEKKTLVVCGGFHCLGIARHLKRFEDIHGKVELDANLVATNNSAEVVKSAVHLVPYSLQRLNSVTGYAAGFPDCGYYQQLWQSITQGRPRAEIFAEVAAELNQRLRDKGFLTTFPDAMEATVMAQRLASLRNCGAGRMELRDALQSSFLKQANDESATAFNSIVDDLLAGNAVGKVGASAPLSPLVEDFRRTCEHFNLPLSQRDSIERSLDLYRSDRQRALSCLLNQLRFLEVPYGNKIAGPDFAAGVDLERVREIWHIAWSIETEARLAECSDYGHCIAEAAFSKLKERFDNPQSSGLDQVELLIASLVMGLHALLDPILLQIQRWCSMETSVVELGQAFHHLILAHHFKTVLSLQQTERLQIILEHWFERICVRLPWLGLLPEEHRDQVAETLVMMSGLLAEETAWCDPQLFYSGLQGLLDNGGDSHSVGVATGILMIADQIHPANVTTLLEGQLARAELAPNEAADYLVGFLKPVKGRLTYEPSLLALLNDFFAGLDEDDFLTILPGLRLAFSQLSPREVRQLAERLFEGDSASRLLCQGGDWSQSSLETAAQLRKQLQVLEEKWGWMS